MQIHRLFEIVYILLDKKGITANQLAERFEVSVRTILRDIDTLGEAGIPVFTMQGKGGGIYIPESFMLDKAAISKHEKEEIIFSLQALRAADYPDIDATLSKLKSFFNMPQMEWVEVDFSRWGNVNRDKEKFETLKNAILKKEAVEMKYASMRGGTSYRTVYPLKFMFKSKAWYLEAYCLSRKNYLTFRINRILELKLSGEKFSEIFQSPPHRETESLESVFVSLHLSFSSDMLSRIYDEFSPESIEVKKDGSISVKADIIEDIWLYRLLLSFGSSVRVIKPHHVKEALLEEVKKIQDIYKT
jgi:predicted DNA-binding transcriptional regulator YafY